MDLIKELDEIDYRLDDSYQETCLSLMNECSKEHHLNIAHIIIAYHVTHTPIKKHMKLPYGCQQLPQGKSRGCVASLDDMPMDLRRKIYAYVHHAIEGI